MASPFAAQLGTNYSPKDEEVLEIKSLLIEPTRRLKTLDDEITELQKAIDKLVAERDVLGAYVDAHKALISPARRLPLDIVQEIFVACLPTHRNYVMSASEAPVLLGRICSAWRAISFSTPRLWARIHIVEPVGPHNLTHALSAQRLETARLWLGRSGQCPLSISLQSAPEGEVGRDASATSVQFLQTLLSFAPRWQHIQLTTPASLLLEIVSRIDTEMPWLETIAFLDRQSRAIHDIEWGHFNILRGARLSSLLIPATIFIPERFPVHWEQLTMLTIGGPTWTALPTMTSEAIWHVISRCSALRRCKLMVNDNDETPMLQHPIIELPFLHTLVLRCITREAPAVRVLLGHLSFPKLRNFTFIGASQDSPALHDFFANSVCMESLTIDTNIFTKPCFIETLPDLPPTIRRLMIRDTVDGWVPPPPSLDDDTLAALMSPEICPALQELYMICGTTISDTAETLTMGQADPRTALKRVDIHFDRPMTIDIMPSLRTFIETGLDVSLMYSFSHSKSSPWQGLVDAPAALTTLTIGGPSRSVLRELTSETMFRVISGCPELRCCKLVVRDILEMSTVPPQHPILELPFLHTLAIRCIDFAAPVVSVLLRRLSCNFMASPFATQLGMNYCPKDEEVLEIKSHLVEPTQRLRGLDKMIADLQKTIDKLVEERDDLGIYVDAHKALISPARRVPLDIVQEIFVACLPTHRNCVMSASEAPVLLGRICSSWRAISFSTPRLWARIHIVEPVGPHNLTHALSAQRLETTRLWLGRSGSMPFVNFTAKCSGRWDRKRCFCN
ncbi:hypothetical protein B0H14DRAFT_2379374 [Mycena olivaceomarginata]|nr:hypothetical protein B0H14DRAFT_2379374 [Mycena olivaceomarginata]